MVLDLARYAGEEVRWASFSLVRIALGEPDDSIGELQMVSILSGGCACGAIRYEVRKEPEFSIICQCRQCQRISGSGYAAQFAVSTEATTLQGDVKFHMLTADDGNTVSSGFCPNCGSPILKKTSGYPQYLFFHAATLDDPSVYKPQMVVYSESKQPWDHVDPSLPRR